MVTPRVDAVSHLRDFPARVRDSLDSDDEIRVIGFRPQVPDDATVATVEVEVEAVSRKDAEEVALLAIRRALGTTIGAFGISPNYGWTIRVETRPSLS